MYAMVAYSTKYSRNSTQYILTECFEDRNKHSFALTSNVPSEEIYLNSKYTREKRKTTHGLHALIVGFYLYGQQQHDLGN